MINKRASYYLLMVDADDSYEFAVWRKDGSGWKCIDACPSLAWMMSMTAQQAGNELRRIGWDYSWVKEEDPKLRRS